MDIVTHAASGGLLMLALPRIPRSRWSLPLAAAAAAMPDIDVLFCRTPDLFLALHRGITHSFAALPFLALLMALVFVPLRSRKTDGHFSFHGSFFFCSACLLLHIWLDCVTTYGTMPFLPFSNYRVRLNGIYIIDLFLLLPLLMLFWSSMRRKAGRRLFASLALVWSIAYPALGIAVNTHVTGLIQAEFERLGRPAHELQVLPDMFAPIFWRCLHRENVDGQEQIRVTGITALGSIHAESAPLPALPEKLHAALVSQSYSCRQFLDFCLLPVMTPFPAPPETAGRLREKNTGTARAWLIHDLRFGSSLPPVQKLLALRPHAEIPFRLMAVTGSENQLLLQRLVFSDSRNDSGWHAPAPRAPLLLHWLAGGL